MGPKKKTEEEKKAEKEAAKTAEKEDPHLLALLARPLENMHTG